MTTDERLATFLREVMLPYLAEEQGAWDALDGVPVPGIQPDAPRRRGTRAYRMRQRLLAVMAGRADPGPGPSAEQQNDD